MTDTDENSTGNAPSTGGRPKFNSETARAAGRKSAEARKARAEERRLAASSVVAGPLQDGQSLRVYLRGFSFSSPLFGHSLCNS